MTLRESFWIIRSPAARVDRRSGGFSRVIFRARKGAHTIAVLKDGKP
jgi:hypothetical protein